MGYHPETLVFSFPPYPYGDTSLSRDAARQRWSFARWLYSLSPWIGFDVWHIDPERAGTGNRRDDSCRWFDRTPGVYSTAVTETVNDRDIVQTIENTLHRAVFWRSAWLEGYPAHKRGWERVTPADSLALVLMVGSRLEHLRFWHAARAAPWWRQPFIRRHDLTRTLIDLALNPADNVAPSADADAGSFIRLVAAAMNRQVRPWWRHPRWHVHHWHVNFALVRGLKRMLQRCDHCGRRLGFGHVPVRGGQGTYHGDGRASCGKYGRSEAAAGLSA